MVTRVVGWYFHNLFSIQAGANHLLFCVFVAVVVALARPNFIAGARWKLSSFSTVSSSNRKVTYHDWLNSIGRLFNKDGNLVKWWSNKSIEAFKKKTKCLKDQYSSYEFGGKKVSVSGERKPKQESVPLFCLFLFVLFCFSCLLFVFSEMIIFHKGS